MAQFFAIFVTDYNLGTFQDNEMMEELKRMLNQECDRTLDSKEWDSLFCLATEIVLQKGEVLISPGEIKPDVYIVKKGIVRGVDFNGSQSALSASDCQAPYSIPDSRFIKDCRHITRSRPVARASCCRYLMRITLR